MWIIQLAGRNPSVWFDRNRYQFKKRYHRENDVDYNNIMEVKNV